MAVKMIGSTRFKFVGLSSDEKPVDVPTGAQFFASDTGEQWFFVGDEWALDYRDDPLGDPYSIKAKSQRIYAATNQAPIATSTGMAVAFSGLGIVNPAGSDMRLNLILFAAQASDRVDAGIIGLQSATIGAPVSQVAVQNQVFGGTRTAVALAFETATLSHMYLQRIVGHGISGSAAGHTFSSGIHLDFRETLILFPGFGICTYTERATTAKMIFNFIWSEEEI